MAAMGNIYATPVWLDIFWWLMNGIAVATYVLGAAYVVRRKDTHKVASNPGRYG
jgi:hypothetical protein